MPPIMRLCRMTMVLRCHASGSKVIGINTLKLAQTVEAEGFGVAIPVGVALEEFPQIGQ